MSLVLGVIPARFGSTRFPGKVLASLGEHTLVEQVWLRASRAARVDRLIVATDHSRVQEAAEGFGAEVAMTSPDHASGTDRAAEVAARFGDEVGIVLVIQGDEPLITPSSLDRLVAAFDEPVPPQIATLSEPLDALDELFDPNVVKVVTDSADRALYFSRSPIPYHRGDGGELRADFREALASRPGGLRGYRKHQGIYAYTRAALFECSGREPSSLERDEGLEQLRALQAGLSIRVVESDYRSRAVDTPADLERVMSILAEAE